MSFAEPTRLGVSVARNPRAASAPGALAQSGGIMAGAEWTRRLTRTQEEIE